MCWCPPDASEAFMAGVVPGMLRPVLERLRIALPQIARLGLFLCNPDGSELLRWADSDGRVCVCPPDIASVVAGSSLDLMRTTAEASLVDRNDPAIAWLADYDSGSEPLMALSVRRNSVVHAYLIFDIERGRRADSASIVQLRTWAPILASLLGHSIQATANLVNAVRFSNEFIYARDPITGEHQLRMSAFLHVLATEMNGAHGFGPGFADEVAVFGAMHDIGKVGVPDYVLLKPGRFESGEWEVMKTHVEKGTALVRRMIDELQLQDAPGVATLRAGVECHHEYLDGSGYPNGLYGDEIPLTARMVTTADIFDALTHYRPYKRPWLVDDAYDHLSGLAGGKLDRDCVSALKSARKRILETMRRLEYPEGT